MKKACRSGTETGFNAIAQSQHFRVLQIERAIVFRKAKRNLKLGCIPPASEGTP
jgi:hypothetical protein